MNIYENVPVVENERWLVRFIEDNDADDLLSTYGDLNVLPFLNSDNCHDNFYMEKVEDVKAAIYYWKKEYFENKCFVRFSIVDKSTGKVIGTFEAFKRESEDFFTDCVLVRLDLRSDHERRGVISELLAMMMPHFFSWFDCNMIVTKAPAYALKRCRALTELGFEHSSEPLVGHDKEYYDYWVKHK